jgi:hypothetical protein
MKTLTIISVLLLGACTQPQLATETLRSVAYHGIQTKGYAFNACDWNDVYHTKFTAYTFDGRPVRGVICSGPFAPTGLEIT